MAVDLKLFILFTCKLVTKTTVKDLISQLKRAQGHRNEMLHYFSHIIVVVVIVIVIVIIMVSLYFIDRCFILYPIIVFLVSIK